MYHQVFTKQCVRTKSLKIISKGLIAIIVAAAGACLEASTDLIKNNFESALMATRNFFEDQFFPIPDGALLGLNLTFYIPFAKAGDTSAEGVSATIPGSLCLKPNGHSIVRAFDGLSYGHQTNVVIHLTCRPSGRISVSLIPQSGHRVKVYEGRFNDGDKVAFPGTPGSYYAGILTMYRLDARKPKGPWVPLNTCLQSTTCNDLDTSLEE
ncbi:hypothetical protein RMO93_25450 (plasmid) [Escherichia coli]|uniref:hypothetical protein n=1 Tax=Escherichia coli TaxID=562 RepID=UPI002893294C|nr:hypothetical protein [Escherichia coli]WNK06511.1 hypothetical protein RMO93_25450 [Escherichia coli]